MTSLLYKGDEMSKTILIVDDSATQRLMLKKILKMIGLTDIIIKEASNGKEALEIIQNQPVSLILTDLNMPTMSGEELIATLKSQASTCELPIIVITSKGAENMQVEMTEVGIDGILMKPFEPEQLATMLQHLGE